MGALFAARFAAQRLVFDAVEHALDRLELASAHAKLLGSALGLLVRGGRPRMGIGNCQPVNSGVVGDAIELVDAARGRQFPLRGLEIRSQLKFVMCDFVGGAITRGGRGGRVGCRGIAQPFANIAEGAYGSGANRHVSVTSNRRAALVGRSH